MDINLLKTFVEVHRTRHFGRAAERLCLTQSAVSARIKQLEELLGVELFRRARNDIRLTAAGRRLLAHADTILAAWGRARQEVAAGEAAVMPFSIGALFGLWDILVSRWLCALYQAWPRLAINAGVHGSEILVQQVLDEVLDIAFMYEPPQIEGIIEHEIATIRLIMVSSAAALTVDQVGRGAYVAVDWGLSFAREHSRHFPDMPPPTLRMSHAHLALSFLLGCGGTAYLAEGLVEDHLAAGRLYRVVDAPVIDRRAYAVYSTKSGKREFIGRALELFGRPSEG